MPSTNKTPNIGLNQWSGNEYPKRQDFIDDNQIIDTEIGNLKKIAHGAVSDLAALKAIDTTNLSDNITIIVKTLGFYRFDSTSTTTANDSSIVQPATGPGRWLNDLEASLTEKATLQPTATENNFTSFDATGNIKDSGNKASDFAPNSHTHADYVPKTGTTMTGILKAQNNTSYTVAQVHNVILSTGDAVLASMGNGDIWIKYV